MLELLTKKQLEITRLIAYGNTGREICEILSISYKTLMTHVNAIYDKLALNGNQKKGSRDYRVKLALIYWTENVVEFEKFASSKNKK